MMMNAISFEKGKTVFQVLFIVLLQWASASCQLNLYDTDQIFRSNSLQYDCLNYHIYRETLAYQELSDVVDELIPYCFRPENNSDESVEAPVHPLSQKLSFEQVRMADITAQQLLSWSIPLDVTERYQFYLNEPNFALNENFYNCTEGRFGLRCQYSFEFGEGMSFDQIVQTNFHGRIPYSESSDMKVHVPCYVLLKCHRDGQPWCLDWREVCDGKVDCFDEDLDEESCFDMEINECSEEEYRCHNGMCISQDLWEDGPDDTDCLDRSDRITGMFYIQSCFQDPTFRCEEHSCERTVNPFSCGDGQCVSLFEECPNGRHVLLINSMAAKGKLTGECWIAMICLTGLVKKKDEGVCQIWRMNSSAYVALEQCESVFQFPTIPIYSNHVRFFYKDPYVRSNVNAFLLPDYVCYDQHLCDSVIPDVVHENHTCLNQSKVIVIWDPMENTRTLLLLLIEQYFRSCSIPHVSFHNKTKYTDHPSLYKCQNSSKFISKHRIMDGIIDCFKGDDENYPNSCLLNDRYRVHCFSTTDCWSPLLKNVVCSLEEQGEISFQSFCDGINKYFYDNNKIYSDEDGCGNWSCNNIYARCDGFRACSDGRDEANCGRAICPSQTYACISPVNYTVICLASELVNDNMIDCLGALDEQTECRTAYYSREVSYHFRCSAGNRCLSVPKLCNKEDDCPDGEDEFYSNQQFTCDQDSTHSRSDAEEVLCELNEVEYHRIIYFSVHTSSNYPSLEKNIVAEFTHQPTEWRPIRNNIVSRAENNSWPWYCNRGLVVHTWIKNNNNSNRACMCPPSYYGRLCEYQNQRIDLTLRLTSNDRLATYAITSMLIDHNDERQKIDAYDQFIYITKQSCSTKLNRYLLFSTRPKNVSKNYSVRIDVFEKNALTYVGSWYFPIAFLFLPVNRLSISLNLSNHLLQRSSNCSITCNNGECMKYVDKDKYFCRCFPKWSGTQCNIPLDCQTCSSESICIGSSNNHSICVCPIDRFGSRCQLTLTCPINACQNNGRCLPADVGIPRDNYSCICPDRFFGQNCQYRKGTLAVSFDNLYIPSYVVAYFFTVSSKSKPVESTILRKLTIFQHTVIFHFAVPFQLAFIQANNKYYLAVLQQSPKIDISTLISSKQECISVEKLLNSTVLKMIPYQRIIHFHYLCQTRFELPCFIDNDYLCLCTNDHHANCIEFNSKRNLQCPLNNYCTNGGQCLQDHPTCPLTKICLCPNCFFGDQCQFYAKGLGSTLDEILGYEFKRNMLLSEQPLTVKVAAIITILISVIGIINSMLSVIIFSRKKLQEVGCGTYLLASSVTSLFTMILFTLKFWFIFFSHQHYYGQRDQQRIFRGNCYIEPLLKAFLYLDSWLNACVTIERTISASQGVTFNKNRSRRVARWVTPLLFMTILSLLAPPMMNFQILNDETEERSWCVIKYTPWLQQYSIILIFSHYFGPLAINIFSAIFVIIITTRQRARAQPDRSFLVHLRSKLKQYKTILTSSAIIVCLTLPHLIISLILDCKQSSDLLWFYLTGYFLSFCPAAFIFIIFVLPSTIYKKEFYQFIAHIRRRFEIFKLNSCSLF